VEAFQQGLRDQGYVEGRTIVIEFRSAEGKPERVPALAAELVRLKGDVILTGTSPMIRAAQQATSTIPIVMGVSGDPVGDGFVASLARPGGNITGLSQQASDLAARRLELLKEVAPKPPAGALAFHSASAWWIIANAEPAESNIGIFIKQRGD
jgi:putative ABC transport system substrate-binding protein